MNKNFIRIIPKLDIKNGNLIKGINLEGLRILGNPYNFSKIYSEHGADEICYVDNVATLYGTNNLTSFITKTAKNLRIPLTVGGGIRSISDIENILKAGADKVCLNSAIIDNLKFLKQVSKIFGVSTITVIVECVEIEKKYFISKSNGRDLVNIYPLDWCKKIEDNGAGEIFLTSVRKEGLMKGFDIKLIRKISENINIPVVAHGGAGSFEDILKVIKHSNVTGISIASLFHYNYLNWVKRDFKKKLGNYHYLENFKKRSKKKLINDLKNFLRKNNINVR